MGSLTILVFGVLIGVFARCRSRCASDRRLGQLSLSSTPTVEEARAEKLRQLGPAGTYRVYNVGEILHVDYERGELIVVEDGRAR